MNKLDEYGASDIREQFIRANKEEDTGNRRGQQGPKMRFYFTIEDRDKAVSCYKFFIDFEES